MASTSSLFHQLSSLALVLLLVISTCHVQPSIAKPTKHHAGRLPNNVDVQVFLQTCQLCGEFFGTKYSSACVHDKTFNTFALCYTSVNDRK